eukprot:166545_1
MQPLLGILFVIIPMRVYGSYKDIFPLHPDYKFGHDALNHFPSTFTDFNWGAYGTPPNEVISKQTDFRLEIEECPSCWMFWDRKEILPGVVKQMADYLNIKDVSELLFAINASHALNAIIRSMATLFFNNKCGKNKDKSCKILQFSTAFPVVKHLNQFFDNNPASHDDQIKEFFIDRELLQNTDKLLCSLEKYLNNADNDDIFFAIVSHIPGGSSPNTIFDVKRITQLFRKFNIITLIDGAFAIGQIPIDIEQLDVDMYLSNGHKFFFSTRGTTIIYVKKKFHNIISPLVISTVPLNQSLSDRFLWQGTMEDSIWMSFKYALQFREKFGENDIFEYIHQLAIHAKHVFWKKWKTESYIHINNYIPAMVDPILPYQNCWTDTNRLIFEKLIFDEYDTIITIKQYDGIWWTRMMVAIYHEISDFERIADVMYEEMKKMCGKMNKNKKKNKKKKKKKQKKKYRNSTRM